MATISFKDHAFLTLNEADLTKQKVGYMITSSKRVIPCSDGLQWWIKCYPAGDHESAEKHISMFVWVSKPVKAVFTILLGNSLTKPGYASLTETPDSAGFRHLVHHDELQHLYKNDQLDVNVSVNFKLDVKTSSVPRFIKLASDLPFDMVFTFDELQIPVHQTMVQMLLDPELAVFNSNNASVGTLKLAVADFDSTTVLQLLEYCYGCDVDVSVDQACYMLRFAKKYCSKVVFHELEQLSSLVPSVPSFCTVIQYAHELQASAILTACFNFFKDHHHEIELEKNFAYLAPSLVVELIKSLGNHNSNMEVMLFAHSKSFFFVLDYLEKPLIKAMTLQDFCPAVNYAWSCSRVALQKSCAKFYFRYQDDLTSSDLITIDHLLPEINMIIQNSRFAEKLMSYW